MVCSFRMSDVLIGNESSLLERGPRAIMIRRKVWDQLWECQEISRAQLSFAEPHKWPKWRFFWAKRTFFLSSYLLIKFSFPLKTIRRSQKKLSTWLKTHFWSHRRKKNFWSKFWKELKRSPGHPGQLTFEWQIIIKLSMLQIKQGIWLFMKPYLLRAI